LGLTASRTGRAAICAAAALIAVLVAVGNGVIGAPSGRILAAALTPGPNPTYLPGAIGTPPPPPTFTPGPSTPLPVTATPVGTATTTVTQHLNFTLDAARVSQVGDKGDLAGLAAIKPGTRVWLMMYYTVRSLPRNMTRVTTYTVTFGKQTVYSRSFKTTIRRTEIGRFSRYDSYTVPPALPYGKYAFRATLVIGKTSRAKNWKFRVAKEQLPATPR